MPDSRSTARGRLRRPPSSTRAYDGHLLTLVAVLDDIRRHGESARADIVARTGLGRTLVTQRIADLQQLGLVSAGDLGVSTGGRAPT